MRKHIGLILVAVAIVGILALYFVCFTVRWQEKALVLTFGRISRQVDKPGLNFAWPAPIQTVVKFDTRVRTYLPDAVQIQTGDKQTVIAAVYVNWRIQDAELFYQRFRRDSAAGEADVIAYAETTMDGWVSEALNVFAEYDLGQLVTLDAEAFKLDEVAEGGEADGTGMLQRIRAKAYDGKGYGIEIMHVGIRRLGLPDSVTPSVFARMNKDREAEARRLMAQGQSRANTIVGEAESEATEIRARAEAEAKKIEGEGDAEAAQYYAVFLEHPTLANFLRRLDTMRATLSERTTIVLNAETPPYQLLTTGPALIAPAAGSAEK